ncbi:hypothetical protein OC845_006948, partial [Tilletia horrida]
MPTQGPGIFRHLSERVFDELESEFKTFFDEENQFANFLKPTNKNQNRKPQGKPNARRYQRTVTHYEATFTSVCSWSGSYVDRRVKNVSPAKRPITGQAACSYKVECPAKIVIKIKAPLQSHAHSPHLAAASPCAPRSDAKEQYSMSDAEPQQFASSSAAPSSSVASRDRVDEDD